MEAADERDIFVQDLAMNVGRQTALECAASGDYGASVFPPKAQG